MAKKEFIHPPVELMKGNEDFTFKTDRCLAMPGICKRSK